MFPSPTYVGNEAQGRNLKHKIVCNFVTEVGLVILGRQLLLMVESRPSKSWCYTLNNWTPEDLQRFKDFEFSYQVIGKEVGENGTPHLQGFITWKRAYRLSQLKKLVPRAHWEAGKTSDAQNYCMKEDYEIIDNRQQGNRSDIDEAIEAMKEGGLKRLRMEHPKTYIRYHQGMEKLFYHMKEPRCEKPEVTWIWGPSGAGKTFYVVEKEKDLWISMNTLQWFENYVNQEATLFDDFRKDFCTFHMLLRLLDKYPIRVAVKGGSVELTAKRMYITSCYHPEKVYDTREDLYQLMRRIDHVVHIEKEWGTEPESVNAYGNFQ